MTHTDAFNNFIENVAYVYQYGVCLNTTSMVLLTISVAALGVAILGLVNRDIQ